MNLLPVLARSIKLRVIVSALNSTCHRKTKMTWERHCSIERQIGSLNRFTIIGLCEYYAQPNIQQQITKRMLLQSGSVLPSVIDLYTICLLVFSVGVGHLPSPSTPVIVDDPKWRPEIEGMNLDFEDLKLRGWSWIPERSKWKDEFGFLGSDIQKMKLNSEGPEWRG